MRPGARLQPRGREAGGTVGQGRPLGSRGRAARPGPRAALAPSGDPGATFSEVAGTTAVPERLGSPPRPGRGENRWAVPPQPCAEGRGEGGLEVPNLGVPQNHLWSLLNLEGEGNDTQVWSSEILIQQV